jgi:predicted Zn-dependent protease
VSVGEPSAPGAAGPASDPGPGPGPGAAAALRALFDRLADVVAVAAAPHEVLTAVFEGEASEFVRLNRGRLRQAGRVERAVARLRLVVDDRQAVLTTTLPGLGADRQVLATLISAALGRLRLAVADSAPDPLLDVSRAALVLDDDGHDAGFDRDAFVDTVAEAAGDADLVGFAAAGPLARGFCSSFGSRLWYQRGSVVFDCSIHLSPDAAADGARKAVKSTWSGAGFDRAAIAAQVRGARSDAALMSRPVMRLAPGSHRALLAPRAFADLLEMLAWGGFSSRAHLTGTSPLARLRRGEASLSPLLTVVEDMDAGFAPAFQPDGYLRPRRTTLIDRGRFGEWLVAPRTGREFGIESNAAGEGEAPESVSVAAGSLARGDGLARLGTGLAIGNLWYLNFSDRQACRLTGMTRFATFWVEGGEAVAPVEAMRFDDSLYRALGESLEALTAERARLPNIDTYDGRGTGGIEAPGALLSGVRFTL